MKSLAQLETEVAKLAKAQRVSAPKRAREAEQRVQRQAIVARQQAAFEEEQKPKRLLFAALFNAPAPEKKPQPKPMSKSAKRRLKLQQQFEALCEVQDVFVLRKHR